jgi:hypothetical protein
VTEPSDLARDVLARYRRSISPSAGEREALVEGVVRRVGHGPGPGGGGGASGGGSWVPWLAVVGAAALVGGWMWASRDSAPVEPAIVASAATEDESSAPAERVGGHAPELAVGSTTVDVAAAELAHDTARPELAAGTAAPDPSVAGVDAAASATGSRASAGRRRARAKRDADAAPEAVPIEDDVIDEEVRLLRDANLALRQGRDADAAARFDEHAQRFPDGALVELREVGRARLRCRTASADEARATIAAFEQRFPGSPHLARLARECPTGAR